MKLTFKYQSLIFLSSAVMLTQAFAQSTSFDESVFLNHGPYQEGTVKIDRSQLQTVVTWCSPTLLKMKVFNDVKKNYPSLYQKIKGHNHPLQMAVTVFPPALPFAFAKQYSKLRYVTSVCSPAQIQTFLSSHVKRSTKLKYQLGQSFDVSGKRMAVTMVNCDHQRSGYRYNHFSGAAYGSVGGVALIPKGVKAKVVAHCHKAGFDIQIQ